jgi:CheY-like chemotaxis protein
MNPKVLIVEDDAVTAKAYELLLVAYQCEVRVSPNIQDAMAICRSNSPQVILLDIQLPIEDITGIGAWDGFDFLTWLRGLKGQAPVVYVISVQDSVVVRDRATKAGAAAFFSKPITKQALLGAVFRAVQQPEPVLLHGMDSPLQTKTSELVLKGDKPEQPSSKLMGWLRGRLGKRH